MPTEQRKGSGRFRVREEARFEIRKARLAMGMSQAKLGEMMGYDTQPGRVTVSHLERGEGSIEQYMNAGAALGIPLAWVIEYVRSEPEG